MTSVTYKEICECPKEIGELFDRQILSEKCSLIQELRNNYTNLDDDRDDVKEIKRQICDHQRLVGDYQSLKDTHLQLKNAIIERRKKLFLNRNSND